jgi:glycosyltransferase involved in cell wall biosynthesis
MAVPKISVVIPTLNRAAVLAQTIDHIESQTVSRDSYQVIVVDNASTDETRSLLEAKSRNYPNLKSLFQPKPGAAATRNAGLRKVLGKIVLFIDDDIVAEPDLIERHLQYHHQHPKASVIGTVVAPWSDRVDPFLRYLHHRGIYNPYTIASGPIDFSYYHTGNVSTPRSLLVEAGGFNEEFLVYGMEDIELGYRLENLGCRMVHGERARALHDYFPTYDEFISRCEQAGYSLGKLIELHPELEKRFVDNSRWTKLLKTFRHMYSVSSYGIESACRWLARREARRGTGPISRLLELHYYWSIRYHFFLGYRQYRHNARNGNALPNVIQFGRRKVPGLAVRHVETSKRSARSVRLS